MRSIDNCLAQRRIFLLENLDKFESRELHPIDIARLLNNYGITKKITKKPKEFFNSLGFYFLLPCYPAALLL